MSIIANLEKRFAMGPTSDYWYQPGGPYYGGSGAVSKSGATVSTQTAMRLAVFWCCVKILSEDTGSLPLHLLRRLPGGGKERAIDNPKYTLLHDQPNPEMTAMSYRECGQSHLVSWGNFYCEIEYGRGRIGSNQIVALWPITPNRVTVKRNEKQEIVYKITLPGGQPIILPRRQILHIPGFGFDGLVGYAPVTYLREAIGLGMALEEYSELYFGAGTHPGVVVSHPGKLSQPAHDNLEKSLKDAHSGLGKSHRLLLLEEAMKIEKIGMDNKDSQFIESKKYSNIEIGTRILRVPPYMYGEMEKSAWANVEQQALDYVVKTLRPWLVRWEQSLNVWLLSPEERREYFFEHLIDGLMRGDSQARGEFYTKLWNIGAMSGNQICELENWNPIGPEGDKRFVPLNMIPLDQAGQLPEPKVAQNARALYRARLESAYHRIFADAAERIVRKEVKRLRWGFEKHGGNGGFEPFLDEFYQEMPVFIHRSLLPAFLSFAEAVVGMESELNGLKLNGKAPELLKFGEKLVDQYAQNHVSTSRATLLEALKSGKFEANMTAWESERAEEIASEQVHSLAGSVIEWVKTAAHA